MVCYWPKHTHCPWIMDLYPPALEVSHHVSALRNLGGSVQAHVGVLTINHVLLERRDKIMKRWPDRSESNKMNVWLQTGQISSVCWSDTAVGFWKLLWWRTNPALRAGFVHLHLPGFSWNQKVCKSSKLRETWNLKLKCSNNFCYLSSSLQGE